MFWFPVFAHVVAFTTDIITTAIQATAIHGNKKLFIVSFAILQHIFFAIET